MAAALRVSFTIAYTFAGGYGSALLLTAALVWLAWDMYSCTPHGKQLCRKA